MKINLFNKGDSLIGEKPERKWIITYSLLALAGLIVLCLIINVFFGRAFIWGADGYLQFYPTAKYERTFWSSLLSGNPSMMDFNLGEGLDPIQCMTYYGLTDPVNIVFAIFPESWTVPLFTILIYVKIFLSGLFFCFYMSKHSKNQWAVAIGGVVYAFSGFFLFWTQATTFLSAGFLFPLLLYFIDRAFDNKKYGGFALMTCYAYITNYYVGAIMSFMLFVYAVIRIIQNGKPNKDKILNYVLIVVAHLGGILGASVAILPSLFAILSSTRTGESASGYSESLFVYPIRYYGAMLTDLFTPVSSSREYWQFPARMQFNFLPVAAPALALFVPHKTEKGSKERILKWSLIACTIFSLVPLFGKLFNLFSYPTGRWGFALSFVIGSIVVWALPRIKEIKLYQKIIVCVTFLAEIILLQFFTSTLPALFSSLALIVSAVLLLIKPNKRTITAAVSSCLACFIFVLYFCVPYSASYISNDFEYDLSSNLYNMSDITEEEKKQLVRISAQDELDNANLGILLNYKTTTAIWNVIPSGLGEYTQRYQNFPAATANFWSYGLDDRTVPIYLSGSKYYIMREGDLPLNNSVPYGYTLVDVKEPEEYDTKTYVYVSDYKPITAVLFNEEYSLESFEKLDIASRQVALLTKAIKDNAKDSNIDTGVIKLPYTFSEDEHQQYYTIDAPEGYELYLSIDKLWAKDKCTIYFGTPAQWKQYTLAVAGEGNVLRDSNGLDIQAANIVVTDKNGSYIHKEYSPLKRGSHMSYMVEGRTMCLGHSFSGETTIQIMGTEIVDVGNVSIYAIPLSKYDEGFEYTQNNTWYNVSCSEVGKGNYLRGEIDAKSSGTLQISIPYLKGWTAYVDGVETKTYVSGIKYLGLDISEGHHEIELRYVTPGFKLGLLISSIIIPCIVALTIVELILESSEKRRKNSPSDKEKENLSDEQIEPIEE